MFDLCKNLCPKFVRHVSVKQFTGALVGMLILLLLATPIYSGIQYAYERWLPTNMWFEYVSLVPSQPYFKEGEEIRFYSEVKYKRLIRMQWADNLVCTGPSGTQKLQTQVWPADGVETKQPGMYNRADSDDREYWAYTINNIPEDAESCFLQARAIGYTPRFGLPKEWSWTTEWFEVNK